MSLVDFSFPLAAPVKPVTFLETRLADFQDSLASCQRRRDSLLQSLKQEGENWERLNEAIAECQRAIAILKNSEKSG